MFIRRLLEGTAILHQAENEQGSPPSEENVQDPPTNEDPPADSPPADSPPVEAQPDWREKQINRQHRLLKDKDRELADIRAENERLKQLAERVSTPPAEQTPPAQQQSMTREQIQAEAEKIANAKFDQDTYNRDCNDAFTRGKNVYKDKWEPTLKVLGQFSEIQQADVMKEILRTDDPAKVLFELGSNPAEAQRIFEMSPNRRTTEFIKIAIKENKVTTPKPTNAGAPVEPISGRGGSAKSEDLYDDKMSDDDFYAIRQKQKRERFAARNGR